MDSQVAVAVALAWFAVVGAYLNSFRLARRKDRLDRVSQQLNEFYGPLYVSTMVGSIAIGALAGRLGDDGDPFSERLKNDPAALAEWKIWLPKVFMPLNEYREDLILRHSHLIREEEMPECLLQFAAHTAGYKAVLTKWGDKDFSELFSLVPFPDPIYEYATRSYLEVKAEQLSLIGRPGWLQAIRTRFAGIRGKA